MRRQVGRSQRAALLLRRRLELCGKLATIERLPLRGCDLFKGQGMFLEHELFSGASRASSRQERLAKTGLVLHIVDLRLPLPRDGRRAEEALATITDRPLEQLTERQ